MKQSCLIMLLLVACRGPQGDSITGSRGAVGNTGATGPQGIQGNTGITGPQGNPGAPGQNGTNGTNGLDGINGSNGTPGTIITWVQFCPGIPHYPSTFIEGGFCIDNNVYAVYSANDGFMTLIPPGAYQSHAIGSSCNFTLLPNCQIQ